MDVIADRYELMDLLGHGGMARVHAARDQVLDRRVAIKLLREEIGRDPVLRERFLREAKLAARLNHSHIVRVYDAGIEADTPWIAMEVVDGPSLQEEMAGAGPLDMERSVDVVAQVLQALGAAHNAGVVHRDVKPANVLLGSDDAKLSDFGIAKSLQGGGDLTQTNQFIGTPKYIAPEVATGLPASTRSDIYSAAVMLWEMLAGHPPYEHDNPLTLAMMHRTDPLPSLADQRPDLPQALVQAIQTGMAKDPADRPDDAAAFADLLVAGSKGASIPVSTATSPTVALPRVAAQPDAQPLREATMALSKPPDSPSPQAPRRSSPRTGGWGVAVIVAVLLGLALFAYSLTSTPSADPAAPTATLAPSPGPATSPPADVAPVTATDVAPVAPVAPASEPPPAAPEPPADASEAPAAPTAPEQVAPPQTEPAPPPVSQPPAPAEAPVEATPPPTPEPVQPPEASPAN